MKKTVEEWVSFAEKLAAKKRWNGRPSGNLEAACCLSTSQKGCQATVKKLAFLLALVACVAVPMTLIRSDDTTAAGHNARDQTPITKPADRQQPIILRPSKPKGPFRLPNIVPGMECKDRTAHRQPGGSNSD